MGERLSPPAGPSLERGFFDRDAREVAVDLLGCVLSHACGDGRVAVRLTETEAYLGPADPASHAYRGPTRRNATMFGPPGHVYVYFTYGMHWCANLVCQAEGVGTAVLLRAGEIVSGLPVARSRRPTARHDRDLCRGPARLASALGLTGTDDGLDVCAGGPTWLDRGSPPAEVASGPRVGVSVATGEPWRFWAAGDPTVSAYTPGRVRGAKTVG